MGALLGACAGLELGGTDEGKDGGPGGSDGGDDIGGGPDGAPCVGEDCVLGPLGEGVATLAGSWERGFVDGPREVARFYNPTNVAVGPDGRVFVADFDNYRVRVVSPEGDVATLVEQDDFQRPFGMVLSADGETLYVQTDRNDRLEQNSESGTIWRVDTQAGGAQLVARNLGRPRGLAMAPDGKLVLSDNQHHWIRKLDPGTGQVTVIAGQKDAPGYADGSGGAARFYEPYDVAVAPSGDIYVADHGNHRIRKITPGGQVSTVAGSGEQGWADGPAATASFIQPRGLALDADGNLYVSDTGNFCVRRLSPEGSVVTIAGNREPGFHDGTRLESSFFGLEGIDVSPDGRYLYVADGSRGENVPFHRVRRVSLP